MGSSPSASSLSGFAQRGRPPASERDGQLQGVLTRLRGALPTQSQSGQRVAGYILDHPQDVIHASVSEVASASEVSEATVVRLCQRVGYSG